MRELNVKEIETVSGGGIEHSAYMWLTGSSGYAVSNLTRATVLSKGLGLVGAAFSVGFVAGTALNNRFGFSRAIVRYMD